MMSMLLSVEILTKNHENPWIYVRSLRSNAIFDKNVTNIFAHQLKVLFIC